MKKVFTALSCILCLSASLCSQTVQLDANNVRAIIPSNPILFWTGSGSPVFNVPKSGNKNPVFNSTLWIGGMSHSNLYLAAETYRQNGNKDFQSGPVSTATLNPAVWAVIKVEKAMVDAYKADSSLWLNPPAAFLNWPAHGDSASHEAKNLAPFVNVGGDPEKYEPQFGDYPAIKGDQCSYYIFNDNLTHTESQGNSLGIEVHRMVYEIADTVNSFLNNTVFVEYKLFNRSDRNYDSLWFTIYSDFDLGTYNDDYIGTDSVLNMTYVYNGLASDDGPNGYGANPPAEGMVLLNHPLTSSMYYTNDNSNTGNPANTTEYWNYMNARWRNGTALTYGDSGVSGSSRSYFAFSGNPCDSIGWSERIAGMMPGDRRILGTTLFRNVYAGNDVAVVLAYVYTQDLGFEASLCKLKTEALALTNWYKQQPQTGLKEQQQPTNLFQVYPNPGSGTFQLDLLEGSLSITVFDIAGKILLTKKTDTQHMQLELPQAGIYWILAENEKGKQVRKVVVY